MPLSQQRLRKPLFVGVRFVGIAYLAAALILVGCGEDAAPSKSGASIGSAPGAAPSATGTTTDTKGEPSGTPAVVATVDPATAATVSGKVDFTGTAPTPQRLRIEGEPSCAAMHAGKPVLSDEVVVNENKTLKNVVVSVSAGLTTKNFPVPSQPAVFDQKGCMYTPHVLAVMAKQDIEIRNSDATNHNVHFLPANNKEINRGMPNKDMKLKEKLLRPEGPFIIKCEVHNWMKAYGVVFDHPFFAVTDDKGEYKLPPLPPGKYTLTAWHEKYGEQKKEIEVVAKDTKAVDFEYKG